MIWEQGQVAGGLTPSIQFATDITYRLGQIAW